MSFKMVNTSAPCPVNNNAGTESDYKYNRLVRDLGNSKLAPAAEIKPRKDKFIYYPSTVSCNLGNNLAVSVSDYLPNKTGSDETLKQNPMYQPEELEQDPETGSWRIVKKIHN